MQLGSHLGPGEEDTANILTLHDECQHWKMIDGGMRPSATTDERKRAREFWEVLRPISEQLAMFDELPAPEMEKLLRELQSACDALFQAGYREARMLFLLRLVGTSLDGYLKKKLGELNLWEDPYRKVSKALRDATQLLDGWLASAAQLTGVFWQGAWKSGPFNDEQLVWMRGRLGAVLEMRAVHQQLAAVLTASEMNDMQINSAFARSASRSTSCFCRSVAAPHHDPDPNPNPEPHPPEPQP